MTTKQQYQEMYRNETGRDFERSELEPMEPTFTIDLIVVSGLVSLLFVLACGLALYVVR